jgi:hypothetical protein
VISPRLGRSTAVEGVSGGRAVVHTLSVRCPAAGALFVKGQLGQAVAVTAQTAEARQRERPGWRASATAFKVSRQRLASYDDRGHWPYGKLQ